MTHPAAVVALLAVSLGLTVGACSNPTDPNTERVVGRIDPSLSSRPVVSAPQEVRAGVAFTVTVTTVAFGCATAEGGLVEIRRNLARVTPYDRVPEAGHGALCGEAVITLLPRDLRVTLSHTGTASLRVVGLSASTPDEVLDSVDVAINVVP